MTGKDRLSMSFIDQLNSMAEDLVFQAKRSKAPTAEVQKSLSLAVWALYMQTV